MDVGSDGSRERFCWDPMTGETAMLDVVGEDEPGGCASSVTELVEKLSSGWAPFGPVE